MELKHLCGTSKLIFETSCELRNLVFKTLVEKQSPGRQTFQEFPKVFKIGWANKQKQSDDGVPPLAVYYECVLLLEGGKNEGVAFKASGLYTTWGLLES